MKNIKGDLTLEQVQELMDSEGNLYLRGCTWITALPDNLTVGGYLDLEGCTGIKDKSAEAKKIHDLINGDMKPGKYIYVDNTMFLWTGKTHKAGKYTVYTGKIKDNLLVSNGELWAHCNNLKDGIADILFKEAKDRGADQYRGLDKDKLYTVDELKTMYRVITGACRAGTEAFINQVSDLKEKYTILEAIEMTKGQYNASAFARFFEVEA